MANKTGGARCPETRNGDQRKACPRVLAGRSSVTAYSPNAGAILRRRGALEGSKTQNQASNRTLWWVRRRRTPTAPT